MRIVFMGTPDFAAGALAKLIEAGHEIVAVVTQPDRPKGRSGELQPSPVKVCAVEHGIPVLQPERIKRPEAIEELKHYSAEVFVVAAFGQILSQEILDMPRLGCLNIHASLLPKYRGASPIQNVILDGEEETGVTIQQMNAGLDTGDILYVKKIMLDPEETFATLHDRLMELGGEAIVEALPLLEAGELTPVPQNDEDSTYVSLITKEMGRIDFSRSARELHCQVRGMNPWPSAYTTLNGKQLKFWRVKPMSQAESGESSAVPGTILKVMKDSFLVQCGTDVLQVFELQMEGKKRMECSAFLLGVKIEAGTCLGV